MMKSLRDFFRAVLPRSSIPKRQRAGALQDAARGSFVISQRASVLECGGPPPLFHGATKYAHIFKCPFAIGQKNGTARAVPFVNCFLFYGVAGLALAALAAAF